MKRIVPAWSGFAMALLVGMWLSVPAAAQSHQGGGGGSSGSSGGGSSSSSSGGGGGGGGSASSSGGSHDSGGGGSSTGTAVPRGDSGGSRGVNSASSGSVGSTRGGSDGTLVSGPSGGTRSRGEYRSDPITRGVSDPVPAYARPRDGRPIVGTAVERTTPLPVPGGRGLGGIYDPGYYYGGYYPYGFGGLGFGGFYGSNYGYYNPWFFDPFYGGFGGYGGYGAYSGGGDPQYSSSSVFGEAGSLRLKIKPREASVFVDGYYVGLVDEFDGAFQRLQIEAGPHRIEVRAPGYETLTFEVRLVPDRTTTYTGELKKIQ